MFYIGTHTHKHIHHKYQSKKLCDLTKGSKEKSKEYGTQPKVLKFIHEELRTQMARKTYGRAAKDQSLNFLSVLSFLPL